MADERIDIEIVDKVSPGIKTKLTEIATAARGADTALDQLKNSLAQLNTSGLSRLTAAEAKLAQGAARLTEANAKAALSQQRLATEVQRTAAAESRAEIATLRLKTAQEKAATSANKSAFSFSAMKGQIIGVVAALGSLWAAFKLADDFANLENRLRSTGLEGDGLNLVMQKLEDSANNTRSSLTGTVELYSRLAVSSKELGVSQNDLIGFTTSLNQAILLSGANATEAQAGLIQLSQGMASGVLRGDELRSVLEQLPAVADVIAKSMGVTRGKLREMGTDGLITAQTILKAFKEAGPELGERFAAQATTAGQAMTVLQNNAMSLMGKEGKGPLQQVVGLLSDLTRTLSDAQDEVKILAGTLEVLLKVVRTIYVVFSSVWLNMGNVFEKLAGNILVAFGTILTGAIDFAKNMNEIANIVLPDSVSNGFAEKLDAMRKSAESFATDGRKLGEDALKEDAKLAERIKEIWSQKNLPAPPPVTTETVEKDSRGFEPVANAFKIKYESWFENDIADAFSQINDELDRMENTLGKSEIDVKMMDIAKAMEKTKGFGIEESGIRKRLEAIEAQNNALARQAAILDSIKRTDFNTAMSDLNALSASGGISTTGRQDYLIGQNANLFEGTQEALDANVRAYADMYYRIGMLRESNDISESTASQMRTKVWVLENETRFQSMSDMLGNMASLQQSTNAHVGRIGKSFAVAQATIDGIVAVQKTLATYGYTPWGIAMATSAGVAAGVNVAKIQGLPGFEVGGYTGNVAKNQIAGVVHGNEYVMDSASVNRLGIGNLDALRSGAASVQQNYTTNTTTTPAGAPNGQSAGNSPSQQGNTRIINVIDPSLVADYMSSSEGEAIFLNVIRNNSDTVKSVANM